MGRTLQHLGGFGIAAEGEDPVDEEFELASAGVASEGLADRLQVDPFVRGELVEVDASPVDDCIDVVLDHRPVADIEPEEDRSAREGGPVRWRGERSAVVEA